MSRVLWVFGWIGVAIWSLVAFVVYGFIDLVGQAMMRNADAFSSEPETVEWIWRVMSWIHGASTSVTLVVWGLVTLAILSVPWLFDRLSARARPAGTIRPRRDGIIDLAPGDYVVRPAEEARAPGPVPRIGPTRG